MTEPTDREVEARAKAMCDEFSSPGCNWISWADASEMTRDGYRRGARTILRREAALVEALERAERRLRKQVNVPLLNTADTALVSICRETADNIALAVSAHRAATRPEPTLAEAVQAYIDRSTDDAAFQAMRAALAREQKRR